jgi:hypothetical protein
MTTFVEQFVNTYASCPALVTSRIVGYRDAPLSSDYQLFTFSRFNKEEVKKFSERLIRAVTSGKIVEAKAKADTFLTQTDTTAGDLRENPLLLGLMVYIFNARGDVPNNRPEIYKECSLLMFEKWDQRRDIVFEFPKDFQLLDLFGFLAAEIFGNAETEDGVSEEWLLTKLRKFFNVWYEDKCRSVAASNVLVEFIIGRAWIMCEIGPGVFKFTHRTFLEYFFARRLEEEAAGVATLIQAHLITKVVQAQWDVVSHLALQIATFRSGPKSIQALDALLKYETKPDTSPVEEINFLVFLARSLEYLTLPEARLKDAIDYIFNESVRLGATSYHEAIEVVHEFLEACQPRLSFVKNRLYQLAEIVLEGPLSVERTFVLYLMGTRYSGFRSQQRSPAHAMPSAVWNAFARNRTEYKKSQLAHAQADVNEARSYIYIYQDQVEQLYEKYRIKLIFALPPAHTPVQIAALAYFLIEAAAYQFRGGRGLRFANLELSKGELTKLIEMMSDDLLLEWRDARITELIDECQIFNNFSPIDELVYFFDIERGSSRPHSPYVNRMSRCFFLYLLFLSARYRADRFEGHLRPIPRSRHPSPVIDIMNRYASTSRNR